MATLFTVPLESGDSVSALAYTATGKVPPAATLVLAHGAGAPQTHPFMTSFAAGLATLGIDVITFNFLYMEQKRRAPDSSARLETCYRRVVGAARQRMIGRSRRLVIGGKSMGGRIASQVVAAEAKHSDDTADGLLFLGYPLHPPGRPDKLRDAHLPTITLPMLFIQGSRDTFGTPDELRQVITRCQCANLHVVDGGDHSLKIHGKDAPPPQETNAKVQKVIVDWIDELRR